MIIAAFDLATATGVCDGPVGGEPRLWSWYLDDVGPGRPERLLCLFNFVRSYFEKQPCDAVVYEAPMPLGAMGEKGRSRIMMSEANVAFLRGAIGVLEAGCANFRKPVTSIGVQAARSSVLGWRTNRGGSGRLIEKRDGGVRDETVKERVLREVTMLGIKAETHNEADAWVIWRHACHLSNPRLAVAITPLFRNVEDGAAG